ncbi:MAG: histidine kinase [Bacteroidota bacterium]
MSFKSKINSILPIALAVILPLLGLYSHPELVFLRQSEFFQRWILISSILYLLWQAMWYFGNMDNKNKYGWFLLFLLTFYGIVYLIIVQSEQVIHIQHLVRSIFALALFAVIQYAMRTQENIARLLLEKEQLQTENYKVQLKALHSKIDPHFLFNSLNTLRSMVRQQHIKSEQFIMSLSDFFRKTLQLTENTSLRLSEERSILQSYLFLMQSRNEAAIEINIAIDATKDAFHLPTLALQILVENCFKHNSMTTKQPLKIEIRVIDHHYIEVRNNIQPKIGIPEESGYGLNLLKKRYELMNISDGVIVEKTKEHFSVKIKLIEK